MIHFVGAGCGAPDLITVRGQRLLQQADVVIYAGSLVNPQLLEQVKEGCRLFDSAYMTLEEVLAEMERAEQAGQTTVRLHSGDPSLYGAIREQIDWLDAHGIAYDITPGVSAFSGAAAALGHLGGAEYTLPGVSQTLIITRIAGRTPVPEKESIRELASHRASMAIYLSTGHLRKLSEELITGGFPPDTPAAAVYKASWPEEKTIIGTVASLPDLVAAQGIVSTALILVGDYLGTAYDRSKLYDPGFSTGFREAKA